MPSPETASEPSAYYVATGPGSYRTTSHAEGAWAPGQQHMGPISGLLVHELLSCAPRDDLALARVTFDILGVIPLGDVQVLAQVTRPGRTIELLEAELIAGGRPVVRAHAWRLARGETQHLAGSEAPSMAGVEDASPWDGSAVWAGGFIASLDIRVLPGWRPGRGQVWLRPRVGVLDATAVDPLACIFAVIDTMNGVAIRERPEALLFPNTDLTVHLFRTPYGEWLGLDVEVSYGPAGVGLTSAVLSDASGPFGRALQILTLRPR